VSVPKRANNFLDNPPPPEGGVPAATRCSTPCVSWPKLPSDTAAFLWLTHFSGARRFRRMVRPICIWRRYIVASWRTDARVWQIRITTDGFTKLLLPYLLLWLRDIKYLTFWSVVLLVRMQDFWTYELHTSAADLRPSRTAICYMTGLPPLIW
jgi:hypothetical protein